MYYDYNKEELSRTKIDLLKNMGKNEFEQDRLLRKAKMLEDKIRQEEMFRREREKHEKIKTYY